jgi:hypothetical protein
LEGKEDLVTLKPARRLSNLRTTEEGDEIDKVEPLKQRYGKGSFVVGRRGKSVEE